MVGKTIRASVAQCCTAGYDVEATLVKMRRLAQTAKDEGSQLVVFPEAFIGGYPKFSTFGARVGVRSDEGRQEFVRYHAAAVHVPSSEVDDVADIASELGIFIITGFIEKDGGTLYCATGFFDPVKGLVYKRRKLMPTGSERLIWGLGDEKAIRTVKARFDTGQEQSENLTLSSAICWENYMPLLRTHYYSQGTQLYCVSTVDARETWESTMRHIAIEGRCFVLSACQFARQKDFPEDHAVDGERNPEAIVIAGGSMIVSPLGQVLAGPLRGSEGVLTAMLNLDDIIAGKFDLDVTGHYARDDIFKLVVKQ